MILMTFLIARLTRVTVMLEEAAVDCRASKPVMIAGKVIRPCVAAIIYDEDAIVHFRTQLSKCR